MKLSSSSFQDGGMIPYKYTCKGDNVSPRLLWSGVPEGTKSFALISDDPDAPSGTWVHWVIYNIPPDLTSLDEAVPKDNKLKSGVLQGKNDFGETGYEGPCPPSGIHRYFFKLYALDQMPNSSSGLTKPDLLKVMEGHILAQTELIGNFEKRQVNK